MTLILTQAQLQAIHLHLEKAYPEESAGFLLGTDGEPRYVQHILPIQNARPDSRHNRYLIEPLDYLHAEDLAARWKMSLLGVFHSHPDHPNIPSEYDREWAQPFFSYVIVSVENGKATSTRCWRLDENRQQFLEETIQIEQEGA
jgi:proteasome lid subunit RPN8/RPN11